MRITIDLVAVSVTVEDESASWTFDTVETLARIAGDRAVVIYRQADLPEDLISS